MCFVDIFGVDFLILIFGDFFLYVDRCCFWLMEDVLDVDDDDLIDDVIMLFILFLELVVVCCMMNFLFLGVGL